MKFANIDSNTIAIRPGCRENIFLNFGDHIQIEAINYMYKRMGIPLSEIIRIPIQHLQDYSGEDVYLPLNFVLYFSPRQDGALFSPHIHPIFLAVNFEQPPTRKVEVYLRKFAPIGCRDEVTYHYLIEKHIPAYFHGCMTCTFPRRHAGEEAKTVYLVDAPDVISKKIPCELSQNLKRTSNGFYGSLDDMNCTPQEYYLNNYRELAQKAKMVVTSRLHVASPCIAMGIPVILATKRYISTYSWIDKYIPVYDADSFDNIEWTPTNAAIAEEEKDLILRAAIHHINSVVHQTPIDWALLNSLTSYYSDRPFARDYSEFDTIKSLVNEVLEILKDRVACGKPNYAIWGITALAESLYETIEEGVPESKLVLAIDTYKTGEFQGCTLIPPDNIPEEQKNSVFYIIPAEGDIIRAAHERFAELGIKEENCYFLYEVFRKRMRGL